MQNIKRRSSVQRSETDQIVVCNSGGRFFLRWFACKSSVEALLRDRNRTADDVVYVDLGAVRVELSLHDSPDDCRAAAEECKRRAEFALAPPRGAA